LRFAACSAHETCVCNQFRRPGRDIEDCSSGNNNNQTVSWQFDVLTPVWVTGLGWFDQGAGGLGTAHTVDIWAPN